MRENIREFLERDPFVPFRVVMFRGKAYDVMSPSLAVLMKSELFVAFPDGERSAHIPLLHITAIETLTNGRGKHGPRKKN